MVGVMLDVQSEGDTFEGIVNQAVNNILLMKILPRIEGDAEMFALSKDYKNKMDVSYYDRLEWLKNLAPDLYPNVSEVNSDTGTNDDEAKQNNAVIHHQTAKEKIQEMIDRLKN